MAQASGSSAIGGCSRAHLFSYFNEQIVTCSVPRDKGFLEVRA
jgi:hypothetical protein